jgi:hypothetical protein
MGLVLKTSVGETSPGVQIPLGPLLLRFCLFRLAGTHYQRGIGFQPVVLFSQAGCLCHFRSQMWFGCPERQRDNDRLHLAAPEPDQRMTAAHQHSPTALGSGKLDPT